MLNRRQALQHIGAAAAVASTSSFLTSPSHSAPTKAQLGNWPAAHGPLGNFTSPRAGHAIVADLSQSRLLWTSEDADLGIAKGSASGYLRMLVQYAHPGSCSGPIVADGRVFCSSFRPAGTTWTENAPIYTLSKQPWTDDERQKLRDNLRIEADDTLTAIDASSGKTVWKAIEERAGLNRYMGKRLGYGVGPVWHAGRVFSLGTTGRLRAYDAGDGRKRWDVSVGPAHERLESLKQELLGAKKFPSYLGWDASLVVADGVLIVPLFDAPRSMGLRGVDPDTGRTLWEAAGVSSIYATPAIFRADGREFVLVGNESGELRLIDPRDGRVLWNVDGYAPMYAALAPSDKHVVVTVNSATTSSHRDAMFGLPALYRISPRGAEHVWTAPDVADYWFENHMDICAQRRSLIRDDRVYFYAQNKALPESYRWTILDVASGKRIASTTEARNGSAAYFLEDRLLHVADASHNERLQLELFSADDLSRVSPPWKPPHESATGYEVFMETPCVDGRIYLRTMAGEIRCFDLRRTG